MLKIGHTLIIVCLIFNHVFCQNTKSAHNKVYNLNYKLEIPLTIGLMATSYGGFLILNEKPALKEFQIFSLNKKTYGLLTERHLSKTIPRTPAKMHC